MRRETGAYPITTHEEEGLYELHTTASYKTEPDGLNHVQFGEAEVPAKELSVQIHNFDYERNN